ncbi:hypothetical protein BH09VER1_BH09VER1_31890 [soil metagenome]
MKTTVPEANPGLYPPLASRLFLAGSGRTNLASLFPPCSCLIVFVNDPWKRYSVLFRAY